MASAVRVGIISIGEMGLGIAKLLISHQYPVITSVANRSAATRQRAESANIQTCEDYSSFIHQVDVILSIVPPKDALETASLISHAVKDMDIKQPAIHYFDLNAVSPSTAGKVGQVLKSENDDTANKIIFYDGGIIGGPPKYEGGSWTKPSLVTSGPYSIFASPAPAWGPELYSILNMRHISDKIGQASGLKMCFASLTKGFTSIAIQSYSTAHGLGVLSELQYHLDTYVPASKKSAERGLIGMSPKAYRWVNEMEEISNTFAEEGGFSSRMFDAVAEVYRFIAEDTVLGEETTGDRKRGLDPEDVSRCVSERLQGKR